MASPRSRRARTRPRSSPRTRRRCSTTSASADATSRVTRWAPRWLSAWPSTRRTASSASRSSAPWPAAPTRSGSACWSGSPSSSMASRVSTSIARCRGGSRMSSGATTRSCSSDTRRATWRTTRSAYAAAYHVLATADLADEAARVRVPTLIVTGEGDIGSNPRMARLLHERIPGSELEILPGLRHAILIEAPATVAWLLAPSSPAPCRAGLTSCGSRRRDWTRWTRSGPTEESDHDEVRLLPDQHADGCRRAVRAGLRRRARAARRSATRWG